MKKKQQQTDSTDKIIIALIELYMWSFRLADGLEESFKYACISSPFDEDILLDYFDSNQTILVILTALILGQKATTAGIICMSLCIFMQVKNEGRRVLSQVENPCTVGGFRMNRFTKTEKWSDAWFRGLSPIEKVVWFYLCDNCDNAGIIEIDTALSAFQIGCTQEEVEGALKGLQRGLQGASRKHLYRLRTFLKHQKNENLNPTNRAHVQIIRLIVENKDNFPSFYEEYKDKIEGASKPLARGTGIGIGKGICNIEVNQESSLQEYVSFIRASHSAFADVRTIPEMAIINSLRTQPDKSKWKPAIETMARHYAGVEIRKPCGALENYLYGKPSEHKPETVLRPRREVK